MALHSRARGQGGPPSNGSSAGSEAERVRGPPRFERVSGF